VRRSSLINSSHQQGGRERHASETAKASLQTSCRLPPQQSPLSPRRRQDASAPRLTRVACGATGANGRSNVPTHARVHGRHSGPREYLQRPAGEHGRERALHPPPRDESLATASGGGVVANHPTPRSASHRCPHTHVLPTAHCSPPPDEPLGWAPANTPLRPRSPTRGDDPHDATRTQRQAGESTRARAHRRYQIKPPTGDRRVWQGEWDSRARPCSPPSTTRSADAMPLVPDTKRLPTRGVLAPRGCPLMGSRGGGGVPDACIMAPITDPGVPRA